MCGRSFACSVPFVVLHARRGCSGFRAWAFNAAFNSVLLLLFLDFSRKTYRDKKARGAGGPTGEKKLR